MKPLNSQDRTKQFFIFLSFFIVTSILIFILASFNCQYNPAKHNELLLKENAELKANGKNGEAFHSNIDSLYSILDNTKRMKSSDMLVALPKARRMNGDFEIELNKVVGPDNILSKYPKLFDLSLALLNDLENLRSSQERQRQDSLRLKQDYDKMKTDFLDYRTTYP